MEDVECSTLVAHLRVCGRPQQDHPPPRRPKCSLYYLVRTKSGHFDRPGGVTLVSAMFSDITTVFRCSDLAKHPRLCQNTPSKQQVQYIVDLCGKLHSWVSQLVGRSLDI